jgi:hypothetical protein
MLTPQGLGLAGFFVGSVFWQPDPVPTLCLPAVEAHSSVVVALVCGLERAGVVRPVFSLGSMVSSGTGLASLTSINLVAPGSATVASLDNPLVNGDAVTGTLRLLRRARVVVSLDSGIGHLASLVDAPQIVAYPRRGDERGSMACATATRLPCASPTCTVGTSTSACPPGAAQSRCS